MANCIFQGNAMTVSGCSGIFLDEVGDDFRVSFGGELVPFLSKLLLQAEIVLHDPVVDDHNLAGAVAMRMSVFFGRTTVCCPAGMAYAVRAMEWLLPNRLFQIPQLAFGTANFQTTSITGDCDSC